MEVIYENSEDNVHKAIVRFHALRSMLHRDMSFDPEGTSSLPAELPPIRRANIRGKVHVTRRIPGGQTDFLTSHKSIH